MKKKKSFIMKNENFFLEHKNFDGLLPILWIGQALARAECVGARGVRGRACVGTRARAQAWALGGGRSARGAQAAAARARGAQASTRAGVGAAGRGRARGAARQGARARGQLGGRRARGRVAGVGARGAGRGRAAWAWPGLALGSALNALGPFSIRFDSFFFS